MGFFDTIASLFDSREPPVHVPYRTVFQGWVQHLAAHMGAQLQWDEGGDAHLTLYVDGEARDAVVALKGDTVYVFVPSAIRFPPGCLPREVASYLVERNRKLNYADWDAIDGRAGYFLLKSDGRMDQINLALLKDVLDEMLAESLALDMTLRREGYVR